MTIKTDLEAVRTKIAEGWTQHRLAVNRNGLTVPPEDPSACAWCISGAFTSAKIVDCYASYNFVFDHLGISPVAFNDDPLRTQAEMLSLLDTLIESAPA